ncbi:MAG: sensor histidine kinase, partial [Phycisphaerales bacterium]|nr:sensor histidine kinase [Phycisphaerales bacterium]
GGVKRLEGLVGQVLQFTREINVHAGAMDLAEAVAQAVEYAGPAIQARGVRCMIDGPDAMPISADPLLLGQAVLNLLLNAVEAAEQGNVARQVTVRFGLPPIESDAKQFHLAVTDSGPGIAPEILDRIFNPFFTTKETGTGLGLAIVHRVVEAHDGTILAMNEPGGGARFEIRI